MTLPFVNVTPLIRVNGETNAGLGETLLSMVVEESLDGPALCQARFSNWGERQNQVDFLYFDRRVLDFGKEFGVLITSAQDAEEIFLGRISALEALYTTPSVPEILVYAEDRLHDLRVPRHTRIFNSLSVPEIIKLIAADHDLEVQAELQSSYPLHPVIAQFEQSDLAFILECARWSGLDVWVRNERLILRDWRAADEIQLIYGGALHTFRVRADVADQINSLSVTGWDVQNKQTVEAVAGITSIQDELGELRSGSQYLELFAARHERLPGSLPSDAQQADALARAAFRQRARRFVSGIAVTQGDPLLRIGGRVQLQGLGPLFSGSYFIDMVRHVYDRQSGYRTELKVSRPGLERDRRSRVPKRGQKGQIQKRPSKSTSGSKKPAGRKL